MSVAVEKTTEIQNLPVKEIMPNPYQPRRHFDHASISELAASIRQVGVISPISVRRARGGGYELISGERRLRAADMAGLGEIPAIIMTVTDRESALIAIIENLQRKNLNCFEEAESLYNLIVCHKLTQEQLAERIGKSQAAIANKLRLLRLPLSVRQKIIENALSERHARALLRLSDEDKQLELIGKIEKGALTVSATEKVVQKELDLATAPKEPPQAPPPSPLRSGVRLFLNTLEKTVEMLRRSGAAPETKEIEHEDYIEYIIRLPKASIPQKAEL